MNYRSKALVVQHVFSAWLNIYWKIERWVFWTSRFNQTKTPWLPWQENILWIDAIANTKWLFLLFLQSWKVHLYQYLPEIHSSLLIISNHTVPKIPYKPESLFVSVCGVYSHIVVIICYYWNIKSNSQCPLSMWWMTKMTEREQSSYAVGSHPTML